MNNKNNNWLCQHFNVQNAVAKNGRIMTAYRVFLIVNPAPTPMDKLKIISLY
jgi:hypothetical protein